MLTLKSTLLNRFGAFLQKHQRFIRWLQWVIIIAYFILLIVPSCMDLPPYSANIFNNLAIFAKFIFWGLWWPGVILSMLVLGRFWCGIFCPEGALSEIASEKLSRGHTIPRWIKWKGWPFLAFALTTIYGQLISVYDYAKPALLILGGSTLAAIIIGIYYGQRGTRVWCRYLCPVNGVFNLLSRLAPISFKTDIEKWANYTDTHTANFRCAPMINIHQLQGVSACHMCGRCDGFRNSVNLTSRSVNEEIVSLGALKTTSWDRILLTYGMIALAIGAFTWTKNPHFIPYKQALAEWLINHNILWPLNANAPWWALTNYPSLGDKFTWLDGFCIISYILIYCIILGGFLNLILRLVYYTAKKKILIDHFSMALLPLAFAGLFLGLSSTSINLLNFSGIALPCVNFLRSIILALCGLWSIYLAIQILQRYKLSTFILTKCLIAFLPAPTAIIAIWGYMFWIW
ncbi:4Fe-4S binding protein [Bartonella sp. TP]|uniref:4Fe-4S binding protein n=1 Tax=Bartonella sp. TP TaxID=3057550 RepID=UPI0025B06E30|nr:4Fe-4S binding protein [Bartonella sp. TP]MDN5249310.1 4Fe-4S binding protein [Alphaproteobacteria bacterium]WJW79735.1 4Fe-4S binding protein [Bartonella sp. TP]